MDSSTGGTELTKGMPDTCTRGRSFECVFMVLALNSQGRFSPSLFRWMLWGSEKHQRKWVFSPLNVSAHLSQCAAQGGARQEDGEYEAATESRQHLRRRQRRQLA